MILHGSLLIQGLIIKHYSSLSFKSKQSLTDRQNSQIPMMIESFNQICLLDRARWVCPLSTAVNRLRSFLFKLIKLTCFPPRTRKASCSQLKELGPIIPEDDRFTGHGAPLWDQLWSLMGCDWWVCVLLVSLLLWYLSQVICGFYDKFVVKLNRNHGFPSYHQFLFVWFLAKWLMAHWTDFH